MVIILIDNILFVLIAIAAIIVVIMNMVLVHRGQYIEKSYLCVLSIIILVFEVEEILRVLFLR